MARTAYLCYLNDSSAQGSMLMGAGRTAASAERCARCQTRRAALAVEPGSYYSCEEVEMQPGETLEGLCDRHS